MILPWAIRVLPAGSTTVVITLTGDLDAATTPTLAALLDLLPRTAVRYVVVEARHLRLCDMSGLRGLASAHHALRAAGGRLAVAAPPPALRRLITLTGRDGEPVVPLYTSVAAALSSTSAPDDGEP